MGSRLGRRFAKAMLTLFTLLWSSLAVVPTASADEQCLKQVFGRYCLGGDLERALRGMPAPLGRQSNGDSLAMVFADGTDKLYLLAYKGRIYKVVRAYAISTQLRFDDIYNDLRQIYGDGEDHSRFPSYAKTPAARLASIRRGEGRATHRWDPTLEWHIELSWTRELGVSLAYIATALDAERAAQAEGGL
ncbi:hypothetical protein [Thiorhodococcus minor]|uniref:Uncharacterized protein n=1 Tax=Thiorhodococcus minor TaxID=57489 RepID=A0A6M0K442_9GAMM|nr:hypothetical protein [Thiorhodococcus minor]NEV64021.1 hypothetical protein [Thiorhodococcus minor]